jgi:NADH-quinone oxidoreductase subunit E
MLTSEERAEIEAELPHYPNKRAVCIDAMKIVQRHRGWVSPESIRDIAEFLDMPAAELESVGSFYNLIHRKPVGRHVIWLCNSVSCWIMGHDRLRDHIVKRLQIQPGETTADNRFTLLPIVCLGACDHAPTMMIGDDMHLDLDPAKADQALDQYK